MRKFLRMLLLPVVLCISTIAAAQDQSVSGTVVSTRDGSPLDGATVQVKGTTRGIETDAKGYFKISAGKGTTLVVSYLGYTSKEYKVGDKTSGIIIGLAASDNSL